MEGRGHRRAHLAAIAVALLVTAAPAAGQYGDYGEPGGDSGAGDGRVEVVLSGKHRQKSTRVVKAQVRCDVRACLLDARATLRHEKRKASLRPVAERVLAAGETDRLRFALSRRALELARRARRDGERARVRVRASGRGVGGGGRDRANLRVLLKAKPAG